MNSSKLRFSYFVQDDGGIKISKRRSGDSKYGFSSGTNGGANGDAKDGNESVDDLPLPPHPSETPPSGKPNGVLNGGGKRYSSHFPTSPAGMCVCNKNCQIFHSGAQKISLDSTSPSTFF